MDSLGQKYKVCECLNIIIGHWVRLLGRIFVIASICHGFHFGYLFSTHSPGFAVYYGVGMLAKCRPKKKDGER